MNSAWRAILDYFSCATQIGLTATPKDDKDASNIDYFGKPVYMYSLKQGIDDGFLAPYRVIRVLLDKDAEGFRPYIGQVDKFGNEIEDREYNSKDYDRNLVLEQRTKLVAKVVSNYLKKHNTRFDKAIFFCVDTEHADRMRQALINENSDLVMDDERYVMRMTGDDDIGKKQLDNFRDVSSKYPVLVTTSKLLTTGIDAQMVKIIVLDASINSMTEFKQIIGRGTRVREDLGKMFFTIFDFRNATHNFADPDFDGPSEQETEVTPDADGVIPPMPDDLDEGATNDKDPCFPETPEPSEDGDKPKDERRMKYYVHDVEVTVLKQRVQYIDKDGKLIEADRGCGVSTRNTRLAAIRAFIKYAANRDVTTVAILVGLKNVAVKKPDKIKAINYMSMSAVTAIVEQTDALTPLGLGAERTYGDGPVQGKSEYNCILMQKLSDYCDRYFKKCGDCGKQCTHPCGKCSGSCADCLKEIQYHRSDSRTEYDCKNMLRYYTCHTIWKRCSEIIYAIETIDLEKYPRFNILSIGCGAAPDLMAFSNISGNKKIKYHGIDIATKWKDIHDFIIQEADHS